MSSCVLGPSANILLVHLLSHQLRSLVLSLTAVIACSSTTRNTANGDDDEGVGGASTSNDSPLSAGGMGGSVNPAAASAGGSSMTTSDAGGTSSTNGDNGGGSGGASVAGTSGETTDAGGASAGGTGGDSTSDAGGTSTGGDAGTGAAGGADSTTATSSTSTTGVSCPDDGACTSECPCSTGEGVCTNDDQCEDSLVCTTAAVAKLGFTGGARSCMPAHCDNDDFDDDLGETSQDCGGECGCRATFEEVEYQGVPGQFGYIALEDMSGDGSTLVGFAFDAGTYPIVVSASGSVTFLEAYGVIGSATYVSDNGSIVTGWLACDDPPDCTDGSGIPFRWSGTAGAPVRYPFSNTASGMSSSGNVVVYTEQSTNPDEAHRLVVSTGANTTTPELNVAYGVSGNGAVVHGILAGNGNSRVWYTQTNEVWTPTYPSDWVGAGIAGMSADGSVFVGGVSIDGTYGPFISQDRSLELVEVTDDRFTSVGPSDMSADGTRFVGYGYNQETNASEGIFWDEAGGLRTLYDELTARGLEFPVDVMAIGPADFISSNGRIIVGNGPTSDLLPFYRVVLAD